MFGRILNFFSTKGALGNPPQALLDALGVWPSTTGVSAEMALRVPAVSCAVRAISEATACLPLSIYRVGPDASREEAADHPVYPLLKGDWNDWTGAFDGLLATTVDALCNDSGGLVWVNRIDGVPRELIRYRPGSFTVDYDLATNEPTFRLATATGGNRPSPLNEVVHVRAFGAVNRAPLSLAREAIGVALLMEQHASKLFARGARPSGVLKFKRKLDDATYERLGKSWSSGHGGENSGRTAILEDDADFQALTFSSTDAQFLELRTLPIRLSPTATSGSVRPCSWTFTSVAIFGSHNRSQSSSDFFPTTRPAPPTWRRLAGATGLFAPIVRRRESRSASQIVLASCAAASAAVTPD